MPRKTIVYVDGFNLYYGALRNTRFRWLDLEAFCRQSLSPRHHDITAIKYFTARVSGRPDDPGSPIRQALYLRALRTTPLVECIFGHFLAHPARMWLVNPPAGGQNTVEVWKTEEKGSDVNLATHLLMDAVDKKCEAAVLVTNDSDLAYPVEVVRQRCGMVVGVINPFPEQPAVKLGAAASFVHDIEPRILKRAQFSRTLRDAEGIFEMPQRW